MRVLVTGVFGYLGLAVAHRLAGRFDLVGLGRAPRRPVTLTIPTVIGELGDVPAGPFDAVVHLAGGGGPAKVQADPVRAIADNVTSTAALLAATRGARVLYASTIAVYGTHRASDRPYREQDGAAPDDLYGALKAAGEAIVALAGGTSLRLANLYGAGAGVDLGIDGAVERFTRAAAGGGELTLYGTGAQRIDYLHVDDAVDAIAAALEAPALPPAINVGSGAPVAIGDLARLAVEAGRELHQSPRLTQRPAPSDKVWPDRSLDIALAAEVLGWRPRIALADGVREMCAMMARA